LDRLLVDLCRNRFLAALAGVRPTGFGQISVGARTILGVAVGASITPAVASQLPQMAASVAPVPTYIAIIALIGVPYFRGICGFDTITAYYCAMPGGSQDMKIFGSEAGGNPRILSLIHATRVLIIVAVAPILLVQVHGKTLANPIGAPAADQPWAELAPMALAALVAHRFSPDFSSRRSPRLGIDHVDRSPLGNGADLVEDIRDLQIKFVFGGEPDVRGGYQPGMRQQRVARIGLEHVHCRGAGPTRFKRGKQHARCDQPRAPCCPAAVSVAFAPGPSR